MKRKPQSVCQNSAEQPRDVTGEDKIILLLGIISKKLDRIEKLIGCLPAAEVWSAPEEIPTRVLH